ncbi:hypothetical protein BX600DRAFT_436775 [Xylariales sp. PMI_506]|nr:hypothetical protein BX600DRAFT_436775 [Xylariales sp. PMI_506]
MHCWSISTLALYGCCVATIVLSVLVAPAAAKAAAKDGASLYKQLPACAKPCHKTAAKAVGCGPKDLSCLCEYQDEYTVQAKSCVMGACSFGDALRTKNLATSACEGILKDEL